jgi:UDP-3-O-acyl-N-acetylglucosamine deacetylase
MGLIRGAGAGERHHSHEAKGPENGPLRFPDEYVRHKVLDLIGDLALAGRRIEGHVVAERAGHAMHTALVSRLLKDRSAWELAHVPVDQAGFRRKSRFSPPQKANGAWRCGNENRCAWRRIRLTRRLVCAISRSTRVYQ